MPKTSLPAFRHRVIDACVRNTARNWSKDDLITEINSKLREHHGIDGICEKTFYNDLSEMRALKPRGYDAPLKCVNGYYIYTDPTYSISEISLSEDDINSINDAVDILSQFKQLPIHYELSLVQEKILGFTIQHEDNDQIIEFENQSVKGIEFLTPLYKVIQEKKAIRVSYQSFKSTETHEYIVHPYYLKQYRHRWYLISYCETHKLITTYSLDRIIDINEGADVKFREVENKLVKDRFKDIIGITRIADHELQHIKVWISSELSPYIKTKPIHNSQEILNEDEKGMEIVLNLIPNYEFYSIILSFAESIRILSPDVVRDELALKLNAASKMYNAPVDM